MSTENIITALFGATLISLLDEDTKKMVTRSLAEQSQETHACECCETETKKWEVIENVWGRKYIFCSMCSLKSCHETMFNCAHKAGRRLR